MRTPVPALRSLSATFAMACLLVAAPRLAAGNDAELDRLLLKFDDMYRGTSSEGTMSMQVKTARWNRTLSMKVWSKGTDRMLILIEAPAKEKGTATLKVENNVWNYLPKVDRTIKLPASMMSGSWMGSHLANDDLVQEFRFSEDYTCSFADADAGEGSSSSHLIECVPGPDVPVVWGKVAIRLSKGDELPMETIFYDEKGEPIRTFTYSEVVDVGGRMLPRRTRIVPADKPDEYTELFYDGLTFDVDIPDRQFTLQALKP